MCGDRATLRATHRALAPAPSPAQPRGPPGGARSASPPCTPPSSPARQRRVEGASGEPAPPPASGPSRARRFFVRRSLAAETRLGILNSAGEQPAGCAAAGQQLLGPNTAGSPAARELEPPGGADALPATIAATTRNAWWWGCRWWCAVRAPPRGEEQLSQPRAHRPGGARTRAGGRGGRAREGTSRTAATGARSRWGQWRDTERRRKRQ